MGKNKITILLILILSIMNILNFYIEDETNQINKMEKIYKRNVKNLIENLKYIRKTEKFVNKEYITKNDKEAKKILIKYFDEINDDNIEMIKFETNKNFYEIEFKFNGTIEESKKKIKQIESIEDKNLYITTKQISIRKDKVIFIKIFRYYFKGKENVK